MKCTQLRSVALRSRLAKVIVALACLPSVVSCERQPPLQLVDREIPLEFETSDVIVDMDALWDYTLVYETVYDWQAEWHFGWDEEDNRIFGTWDIHDPDAFNIRRYYTGNDPYAPHTSILRDFVYGNRFRGKYKLGFYDLLVWNDVETLDGVQSLHYDDESSLEYVVAYTNQSNTHTGAPQHAPAYQQPYRQGYAFYQPEFLFAGDYDDLHVTDNPEDYDWFDPDLRTWFKRVPIVLDPVTYIYLTQVILHHNNGRVAGIDGSANITGMARSVNMKTHVTDIQDIAVNYPQRMKRHLPYGDMAEDVDIIGGRAFTFGLTGVNPYHMQTNRATRAEIPNYLEVNMLFNNGLDSTFVFNITDQVQRRFKGGVITVHLDMDTVPIPKRPGGSGFDATVQDYEEETYEFEM